DSRLHRYRPGHFDGAPDKDAGPGASSAKRADLALSLRTCGRDRTAARHGAALPAWREPVYPRICRPVQDSRGSCVGRRGNGVSRVSVEIEEDGREMRTGLLAVVVFLGAAWLPAQQNSAEIQALKVQGNVYLL